MAGAVEAVNDLAETWFHVVGLMSLQALVVGLILLAVVRLLRQRSANLRYTLLLLVVAKFMVPPMLYLPAELLPTIDPVDAATPTTAATEPINTAQPEPYVSRDAAFVDAATSPANEPSLRSRLANAGFGQNPVADIPEPASTEAQPLPTVPTASPAPSLSWRSWLMLLHAAGCGVMLIGAVLAVVRLRGIVRRSVAAGGSIANTANVRVLVSGEISVPFSCGVFRRHVILPAEIQGRLTPEQLQAVVAHEVTHHRRGDLIANWVQVLTTIAWWFHPLLWIVNAKLRSVREECCDDRLLNDGEIDSDTYCETLLAVARSANTGRLPSLAVSMAQPQHPLGSRIKRIMNPDAPRAMRLAVWQIIALCVVAMFALPSLAGFKPTNTNPTQSEPVPQAGQDQPLTVISGTVKSHRGEPVAGAKLMLLISEGWDKSKIRQVGSSKSDGTFEILQPTNSFRFTPMTSFYVFAWKDGHGSAQRHSYRGRLPHEFELKLGEPAEARFQIVDPAGKPVAGATVTVADARLGNSFVRMPIDDDRNPMTVVSDANGIASLPGLKAEAVTGLQVKARGYGDQHFYISEPQQGQVRLQLKPIGRIAGHVTTRANVDLAQMRIRLATSTREPGQSISTYGTATVRPDKDGRFSVPAIAEGPLGGTIEVPADFKGAESLPRDLVVSRGTTTNLTVPVRSAVRIRRRLVVRGSGEPIAGVVGHLEAAGLKRRVVTDEDGWLNVWLAPNQHYHTVFDIPFDYLFQEIESNTSTVVGNEDATLPPIQLRAAKQITGVVIDSKGNPQSGVSVRADWEDPDATIGTMAVDGVNSKAVATTDRDGRFTLRRIHPQVNATLIAMKHNVRIADDVVVPQARTEAQIQTSPYKFVPLAGQIKGFEAIRDLKPKVRLYANFSATKSDRGRVFVSDVEVDESGAFKLPAHYPDEFAYRVAAFANHAEVATTAWIVPESDSASFAPAIVKMNLVGKNRAKSAPAKQSTKISRKPPQQLVATITDSDGKPVPNAQVVTWFRAQRQRLKTDSSGNLIVSDVPQSGTWIFIDANGFRFHGQFVKPGLKSPIKLVRVTEPDPRGTMRTLKPNVLPDGLLDRAHQMHADVLRECLKQGPPRFEKNRSLEFIARIDPVRATEFLPPTGRLASIRDAAAAHQDLTAALKKIKESEDPKRPRQLGMLLAAGKRLSTAQKQRIVSTAIELLEENAEDLTYWAILADQNGMATKSKQLLARALKVLPRPGESDRADFIIGSFARAYAATDHEKAQQLVSSIKDQEARHRYQRYLAQRLAAHQPNVATDILSDLNDDDKVALKVAAAMAGRDGTRARRIAYGINNPKFKAYALAWVANANPNATDAERLIEKAFDILIDEVNAGEKSDRSVQKALTTAVAMLPIVERVAPNRLRECFWKALSLRRNIAYGNTSRTLGPHGSEQANRFADSILAVALSRYDRSVAKQIAFDPEDETLDMPAKSASDLFNNGPYQLFLILAAIDPQAAVKAVEALPADTPTQLLVKLKACQQITRSLSSTPRELWQYVMDRHYYLSDPRHSIL